MLKRLILFLALLLPVFIYLFLQGFGSNEYELPVLYQESVPNNLNCDLSAPYELSFSDLGLRANNYLVGVYFETSDSEFVKNEIIRVEQYFEEVFFEFLAVGTGALPGRTLDVDISSFAQCKLLKSGNNSFIALVDKSGRIRSYYDCSKRQEFDRMITELEILNKFK